MKVLVTGGAGYIGSIVAAELKKLGNDVVIFDDLSTGHKDAVAPDIEFIQGNMLDESALNQALVGVDAVIHFAAKSLVGESVVKPDLYWTTNLEGTRNLLNQMKANGVNRIVFSSTAAVYGDPQENPITENSPTLPKSPYGESKLAVDNLLAEYAKEFNFAAISLRYFNVAGATNDLGERHNPETHLIPRALAAVLEHNTEFEIYGDDWPTPDGTCIRDYIHVVDLADAHIKALGKLINGQHQIFNLGTETGASVLEVVEMIEKVTNTNIERKWAGRRDGDPAVLVASNVKAKDILGWSPTRNLEQIVTDAYNFMKANNAKS